MVCPRACGATVIVTVVTNDVTGTIERHGDNGGMPVTFTETLLRNIVPLTDGQQEHLVKGLANRGMKKGTFRRKADAFRRRNAVSSYIDAEISGIDEDLRSVRARAEVACQAMSRA